MKKIILCIMVISGALLLGATPTQTVWATNDYVTDIDGGSSAPAASGSNITHSSICDNPDYANDPEILEAAGCHNNTTAVEFANNLITVVLSLIGLLAIGVMIYGGVMYTISTGDAAKVQRAKHIIMYGIIGIAVVLLAYAIVYFVGQAIGS